MPHTIERIQQDKVISVSYTGGLTLTERMAAVNEVCDMLTDDVNVLMLIDVRQVENKMSTKEQEFFGEYLANKPEFKRAKIAVLSKPDHNPNTIINNTAYLNGYHIVPFTCRSEAIYWLEGSLL